VVGLLTLGVAVAAGMLAARTLGTESPWVWTIGFLACLASGVVLMGNPRLYGLADRIERAAGERERRARDPVKSPTGNGHG
jgi:hypothetical protein